MIWQLLLAGFVGGIVALALSGGVSHWRNRP